MSIYIITDCRKDTAYLLKSPFFVASYIIEINNIEVKYF